MQRNTTKGWMEDRRSGGKDCGVKSSPPIGDDPVPTIERNRLNRGAEGRE